MGPGHGLSHGPGPWDGCLRKKKKHAFGKLDAKAFFEIRRGVSDAVFREEFDHKAKNGPKPYFFRNFQIFLKKMKNFEKNKISNF